LKGESLKSWRGEARLQCWLSLLNCRARGAFGRSSRSRLLDELSYELSHDMLSS